jgi:two-component system OmpR family response regulator
LTADAGEALEIDTEAFDVVVLDLRSVEDGLGLLKDWRRNGLENHVFVLTTSVAESVRALDLGADAAVKMPCPNMELLARYRAMLRLRRLVSAPILRVFDLEVDPSARIVKRAGREIHLTPKEFRLLHFLLSHRGKALSRTAIFELLSSSLAEARSNLVAVYIRYLRCKIDRGADLPLILTVRGRGYAFRSETNAEPEAAQVLDTPSRRHFAYPRPRRHQPVHFHQSAT